MEAPYASDDAVRVIACIFQVCAFAFIVAFYTYDSCGLWWCDIGWDFFRERLQSLLLLLCVTALEGGQPFSPLSTLSALLMLEATIYTAAMNTAFYGPMSLLFTLPILTMGWCVILVWKEREGVR